MHTCGYDGPVVYFLRVFNQFDSALKFFKPLVLCTLDDSNSFAAVAVFFVRGLAEEAIGSDAPTLFFAGLFFRIIFVFFLGFFLGLLLLLFLLAVELLFLRALARAVAGGEESG